MLRIRTIGSVVLAVALLAAACGEGDDVAGDPQDEVEAPSTTQAPAEEPSDPSDPAEPDVAEPVEEDASGSDPEGTDDAAPTEDVGAAAPADAEALLASAATQLDGRSVRGEATIELAPGFGLSTSFESDAEGDLAALVELPPGLDPEFPAGADAEMRYVGGVAYVRPPVPPEVLAELGLDEAWYVAEPAAAGDPMAQAIGSAGVMCIFPPMGAEPVADCDPVGEINVFLEGASEAEVVGREDVRGVEATRVRFLVSLLDLAGEDLGISPDDGEPSEGGAFDDTASDPFAEGIEQIFGFLDAEFEVEVWIDDESLVRRLSFDLASLFAGIAGPEAAAEMPSSLIILEFYDYDADISVEVPPPESIVDGDLLVGGDDYATSEEFEPSYEGCEEIYDEEYDETIVVCE